MNILITAPDLEESRNVSGISTVVRQIIERRPSQFTHFIAGSADRERKGPRWLIKQLALPIRFLMAVIRSRPDLIHINTALTDLSIWRDLALLLIGVAAGRPILLAIHGGKYLMNEAAGRLIDRAIGIMLRRSAAVVVLSEIEKASLLRRWPDVDITVLPNAIDTVNVPAIGRTNDTPVVVFLGRLHESKGIHELADACGKLHSTGGKFILRCYGDGPEKDRFIDTMNELLGRAFEYRGVVAGKEKWAALAASDIFVLPSIYGEGMPMALLEAMACGCVVIASDNASISAVIESGKNGYIVPAGDVDALAEKLALVIEHRDEWPAVSAAAKKTIEEKFAIDRYFADLESIYSRAAAKK